MESFFTPEEVQQKSLLGNFWLLYLNYNTSQNGIQLHALWDGNERKTFRFALNCKALECDPSICRETEMGSKSIFSQSINQCFALLSNLQAKGKQSQLVWVVGVGGGYRILRLQIEKAECGGGGEANCMKNDLRITQSLCMTSLSWWWWLHNITTQQCTTRIISRLNTLPCSWWSLIVIHFFFIFHSISCYKSKSQTNVKVAFRNIVYDQLLIQLSDCAESWSQQFTESKWIILISSII